MPPPGQWQPRSCGLEPSCRPRVQHLGIPEPAPIPPHPPRSPDRAQRHLLRSARPVGPREPQSARGCGVRELPGGLSDRRFPPTLPRHGGSGFPPWGGARTGGGAPGGRGAISSLAGGFARTSLRAFPALEPDPVAPRGGDRTGRWRRRPGGRNQCWWGPNRSTPPQPLLRAPAADSTPIVHSQHLGLRKERDPARPESGRRSSLLPKRPGGGILLPPRTEPDRRNPWPGKQRQQQVKCLRPTSSRPLPVPAAHPKGCPREPLSEPGPL